MTLLDEILHPRLIIRALHNFEQYHTLIVIINIVTYEQVEFGK